MYTIFLLNFNQTQLYKTDINKSPHLKSSQKSIQWEPNCGMKTGRQKDANSLFS